MIILYEAILRCKKEICSNISLDVMKITFNEANNVIITKTHLSEMGGIILKYCTVNICIVFLQITKIFIKY